MLIRISLIVAIIAGLAVGGLNFVKVREKITTLMTDLQNETTAKVAAQTELATTRQTLDKTKQDLTLSQQELEASKAAHEKAVADLEVQNRRATQLASELGSVRTELGDTQARLEQYRQSGLEPEQVVHIARTLKQTQDNLAGQIEENQLLARNLEKVENRLAKLIGQTRPPIRLPRTLHGKILISDPKWNFVVLDVGENQGIKEDGELLVNRNGQLVAKVIVRDVQKDRSIANVMPGWQVTEVLEGDSVIPAHPDT